MLATQNDIRSVSKCDDVGSAIKSLKAVHQITGQYLNRKDVQADQRNTSPKSDQEIEAFSILTELKQLLAFSGLQDGVVTPPESTATQPGTPPPSNKKNISPLTLQQSAIRSPPPKTRREAFSKGWCSSSPGSYYGAICADEHDISHQFVQALGCL